MDLMEAFGIDIKLKQGHGLSPMSYKKNNKIYVTFKKNISIKEIEI